MRNTFHTQKQLWTQISQIFISVSNLCCLYASYLEKEAKTHPLSSSFTQYIWNLRFHSERSLKWRVNSLLCTWGATSSMRKIVINECSGVGLSQMEGNKAVRYFHALWIYLPTLWGFFRGGEHTELPQTQAGVPHTTGVSCSWGYLNSSSQMFATAASKGRIAQFHLLSFSHFDSSLRMPSSFWKE